MITPSLLIIVISETLYTYQVIISCVRERLVFRAIKYKTVRYIKTISGLKSLGEIASFPLNVCIMCVHVVVCLSVSLVPVFYAFAYSIYI